MNQLHVNYGLSVLPIPKPITTKSHPRAVSPMKGEATCRCKFTCYNNVQMHCMIAMILLYNSPVSQPGWKWQPLLLQLDQKFLWLNNNALHWYTIMLSSELHKTVRGPSNFPQ